VVGRPQTVPPSAMKLLKEVVKYTSVEGDRTSVVALPGSNGVADAQTAQRELANSSRRLSAILDEKKRTIMLVKAQFDRYAEARSFRRANSLVYFRPKVSACSLIHWVSAVVPVGKEST
jgi:hypothetical protein